MGSRVVSRGIHRKDFKFTSERGGVNREASGVNLIGGALNKTALLPLAIYMQRKMCIPVISIYVALCSHCSVKSSFIKGTDELPDYCSRYVSTIRFSFSRKRISEESNYISVVERYAGCSEKVG